MGKYIFLIGDKQTHKLIDELSYSCEFSSYKDEEIFLKQTLEKLREKYPSSRYEIIEGFANSVDELLDTFPGIKSIYPYRNLKKELI